MIAWTTTPWTLPSNLALVVNPDLTYVKVKGLCLFRMKSRSDLLVIFAFFSITIANNKHLDNSTEKVYIMMEARLSALFKTEDQYTVLEK